MNLLNGSRASGTLTASQIAREVTSIPPRDPQVIQAASVLSEEISQAEKVLLDLESKLSPVLLPDLAGSTGVDEGVPAPLLAPLADLLREQAGRVYRIRLAMETLLTRLEV